MKELEDRSWFPHVLRNFQTEYIGFVVIAWNVYNAFEKHLKTLSLPIQSMTDLCSGSGEPAVSIFRKTNSFLHLSLTDKYPNRLQVSNNRIFYEMQSVDVNKMEFKNDTCYTMFNAFHHFTDEEKLKIVRKIRDCGATAFFVEILEPGFFYFLKVMIASLAGTLLLTPFKFSSSGNFLQ